MARLNCILLVGALMAAPALAQSSFDLPTVRFNPQNNNYPFAGPRMRYQQWFSAAEWQQRSPKPIRVTGAWFFAGPGRTGVGGRQVDLEVTMANASPTFAFGTFDQNFVSGRVVVFPRAQLTLLAPTTTYPVQIPFRSEFVWDGVSGVVIDIRLYDNGNNNQAYTYDLEYLSFTQGRSTRLYTINDPNATNATTVQASTGLTVHFLFDEAISWPYGQGCPGAGRFVPVHSTAGGYPVPGNTTYEVQLTNAPSQRQALFFMGASAASWGALTLPYDLGGIGAPGCSILAEPVAAATVQTVGGGNGTGIARLPFPMPPTTNYVGTHFYSQWLVLDPASPNGLLCVSNGIQHITAMR